MVEGAERERKDEGTKGEYYVILKEVDKRCRYVLDRGCRVWLVTQIDARKE